MVPQAAHSRRLCVMESQDRFTKKANLRGSGRPFVIFLVGRTLVRPKTTRSIGALIGRINPDFAELGKTGVRGQDGFPKFRSEEQTSELQSRVDLVCRLLLEKKKKKDEKIIEYQ